MAEFVIAIVEGIGELIGMTFGGKKDEETDTTRMMRWLFATILGIAALAAVLAWANST